MAVWSIWFDIILRCTNDQTNGFTLHQERFKTGDRPELNDLIKLPLIFIQ